ncbi:DUF4236 domain-containing protein [Myxococcus sp. MISCRS1]|uniref:DUF4236 domain-containing protein n=1 Tax=Myxococcus sp. MISCRS1 TaxID=2996786 RepID=UPI003B640A67
MGFRFGKRIKLLPGVHANLGKKGVSLSIGRRGLTTNVSSRGVKTTLSIPGTGLSYTTGTSKRGSRRARPATLQQSTRAEPSISCKECNAEVPNGGREPCPRCGCLEPRRWSALQPLWGLLLLIVLFYGACRVACGG